MCECGCGIATAKRFVSGHNLRHQVKTSEHRHKISLGQKRAWDRGRTGGGSKQRIPIGTTRMRNERQQVRAVTTGGWFVWRYTERKERELRRIDKYDRMTTQELMHLNDVVKKRLRRLGYSIPHGHAGAKKGYKQSAQHIERRRISQRRHLFDMATITREGKERLRKSLEYRTWRDSVFRRDDWTCQECGARSGNGSTVYLEAHHKKSFTKFIALRFDVSNGDTLCKTCHGAVSSRQMRRNKNGLRKASNGTTQMNMLVSI